MSGGQFQDEGGWQEGPVGGYAAGQENPYAAGAAYSTQPHGQSADGFQLILPLYEVSGWMRFIGVMQIIGGIMQCLSIWGIIIGWLPIWIGVSMISGSGLLRQGVDQSNPMMVREGISKLALVVRLMGIMMAVGIALVGLVLLGMIGFMAVGFSRL